MYLFLIFVIVVYFLILQINLLSLSKIKYTNINSLLTNEPSLIVCSHDYEQNDVFIIIDEFIKSKKPVSIVLADIVGHRILYYYLKIIGKTNIDFIFIEPSGGTVEKMINAIQESRFVVTFLTRKNKSNGVYHMLKNLDIDKDKDVDLFICKIKSDYLKDGDYTGVIDKYLFNYEKKYSVKYEKFSYLLEDPKEKFMNDILERLYY